MNSSKSFLLLLLLAAHHAFLSAIELRLCANKNVQETACKQLEAVSKDFKCVWVEDSVDCQNKLDVRAADFGVFKAEEALVAAAENKEHIVVAEVRHQERKNDEFDFRTVVVVRASHEGGVQGLKGKNYCHPGFSQSQYWTDPVLKALEKEVMKSTLICNQNISTVESETRALSQFFGQGCRPGAWTVNSYRDGKIKSEYKNLCALCDNSYSCTYNTQQVGSHIAAMSCLTRRGGDVVYNALGVVKNYFQAPPSGEGAVSVAEYNFLCIDGTKQPITSAEPCTWIRQPWPVVLAAKDNANTISGKLKDSFPNDVLLAKGAATWQERLRTILAGDMGTLRVTLNSLESVATYMKKGRTVEDSKVQCGDDIKWCTTSEEEKRKCQVVAAAARTHGIRPRISCPPPAANITICLKYVNQSDADIAVIPTTDGFVARRAYNLQSIMYLESERSSNYYGIIVVPVNSTVQSITDLKGKSACFPRFNGLGWLTYMKAAWSAKLLPENACPASPQTLKFFGKSCAPGINDKAINIANITVAHGLCGACSDGKRGGNCESSTTNPYYGEIGAMRCLEDGAGQAAFLDLNAVTRLLENRKPGGANLKLEAANLRVLCLDGTKAELNKDLNLEKCARIQVIGSEVVTRKAAKGRLRDIQFTLEDINGWFGSRLLPVIKLFGKFNNVSDLLLPSHGVDLINTYQTEGSFVQDYSNLFAKLQHCSGGAATNIISALLAITCLATFFTT